MRIITPITQKSNEIIGAGEHALIGISPFNSYFSKQKIEWILRGVISNFKSYNLFVPDLLPAYTFLALGYSKKEANLKAKKQFLYLKNKILKAGLQLDLSSDMLEAKIITMDSLYNNKNYQETKKMCFYFYEHNELFYNACNDATIEILDYKTKKEKLDLKIAVQYLLEELPIILNTPDILNVTSSVFIYHKTPKIINAFFNHKIPSPLSAKQGYGQINDDQLAQYQTSDEELNESV